MRNTLNVVAALVFAVLVASVTLVSAGEGKGKKEKPQLSELTLTGTLSSQQQEKVGKDGAKNTYTVYYVATETEKIMVPQPKSKKKGESPALNLADFTGDEVVISALGYVSTGKDGAKRTHVHQVTAIRKAPSATPS